MHSITPSFNDVHLLVIGDVMLDRYWHGNTARISPEAPVPIVHVKQQAAQPGGAGNVALNIASLGAKATLLGIVGDDEAGRMIEQFLVEKHIYCQFLTVPQIPTITKLRVLSQHQQLLRLDFEETFPPAASHTDLVEKAKNQYANAAVIILSDYAKGTLTNPQSFIQLARQMNKPILVDPKGKDFSKYQGATLITPNLTEFEAVVGPCQDQAQLEERGENLRQQLALEALLITRSEQGMSLLRAHHPPLHLPAHAREVYDVTGAGDTVISVLAACLAAGEDWINATAFANLAAGLVVGKLGAATVTTTELHDALHSPRDGIQTSVIDLQQAVQSAKVQGETIVMTNGCFDILHAGHVAYLQKARQLGDRLIVAVNDDESVKRLKGHSRPINPLSHRLAVLNALECVDWVIAFNEETPEQLICQILPDILVKGGDYQIADIAGSDCVLANNGQVLVLDYLAGCSTTQIIDALQKIKDK